MIKHTVEAQSLANEAISHLVTRLPLFDRMSRPPYGQSPPARWMRYRWRLSNYFSNLWHALKGGDFSDY